MRAFAVVATLCLTCFCLVCRGSDDVIRLRQTADAWQAAAVANLAKRLLGADASRFRFVVRPDTLLPRHLATLSNIGNNSVKIEGNSGVACAWGLHYYLTQYCSCMITWTAAQVSLPAGWLPMMPGKQTLLTGQDKYVMMPNVCTFSYSYAWWSFNDWERHIDWMAMHGINLAYALTAEEFAFGNAFRKLGLSQDDLDAYFPGPAFLAWSRMGNLKRWGGPLPAAWHRQQLLLQRQILQRMQQLGITPVLQGFSGMVPDAFVKRYPNVSFTRLSDWVGFGSNYSETVLLDPHDPMFSTVSSLVIKESIALFGDVTNFFAMDAFNENRPARNDSAFISSVSRAIFNGLQAVKPQGIWVLQSWFIGNDAEFWTSERVRALLQPVPKQQLLIVDLYGDSLGGLAGRFSGYFGHQFVWTLLHNFGGNNAMFGGLAGVASRGPFLLRRRFPDGMSGVGVTPEGIWQNEVIYEFALEFSWRRQPVDLRYWARDFARRRYGESESLQRVWEMLQVSLYNSESSTRGIPLLIMRPSLSLTEDVYYNTETVESAWHLLLQTNRSDSPLLLYDQVDLTRQMLQLRFSQFYLQLVASAKQHNVTGVKQHGGTMMNLLAGMNSLLATDWHFLLQRAILKARNLSTDSASANLYEMNVRNQLTCWGPGPNTIQDYAGKMYNGLILYYYMPRWQLFVTRLATALEMHQQFNQTQFDEEVFESVERRFYTGRNSTGPTEPQCCQFEAAKKVEKWLPKAPATASEPNSDW